MGRTVAQLFGEKPVLPQQCFTADSQHQNNYKSLARFQMFWDGSDNTETRNYFKEESDDM